MTEWIGGPGTTTGLIAITVGLVVELASSARAVPTLQSLKRGAEPRATLDRFARFNGSRAAAVVVTLVAAAFTLGARIWEG